MSKVKTFPAPKEAVCNNDFSVKVREEGGEWKQLSVYEVKVDMHNVRKASMAQFDMEGTIEVVITCNNTDVKVVTIRPLSYHVSFEQNQNVIHLKLDHPCKLSIEMNGDRFHNLHLFANPIEKDRPNSSDGIDMMSSMDVSINDVFMRNSDDCIAIYGSRWNFFGDTKNVQVKNSILWADVAHAINMGGHGDHGGKGDTIENIHFENIDILEHHEPQENYWGAMSINAGDMNVIKYVTFENIRVEDFELGQLLDIRVLFNKKYNPKPGNRIQNITFKNIECNGKNENPSRIYGYDSERTVENVLFSNLRINGRMIRSVDSECFDINEYVHNITFEPDIELDKKSKLKFHKQN